MRTPALIALAALVGFALAWFLLTRVPQPAPVTAAPVAAVAPAPPVASPPTPPEHAAPSAPILPMTVEENRPGSPDKALPPVPAPQPKSIETPPPADDTADSENSDDEGTDETAGPPPIDTDQAADLVADQIAQQEAASEESGQPNPTAQAWKKFDGETADPEWSEPTAQQIEQTLDQWLAGLPDDVREHIAVIHIECRATMCQILAADNDIDTQNERAQAGQEWQQAIASLPGQPWWNELGFVDASTQVTSSEGHTLYMTYLRREVKPASP
jgi:hypothetical protein